MIYTVFGIAALLAVGFALVRTLAANKDTSDMQERPQTLHDRLDFTPDWDEEMAWRFEPDFHADKWWKRGEAKWFDRYVERSLLTSDLDIAVKRAKGIVVEQLREISRLLAQQAAVFEKLSVESVTNVAQADASSDSK